MSNNNIRAFVGLPIPEPLFGDLSNTSSSLSVVDNLGLSWLKKENYHLTLLFLGEQSPQWLEAFAQALEDNLFLEEQVLNVTHILPFPKKSPHLLAAMLEQTAALEDLHNDVKKIAQQLGFRPEKRKFHPHITMAKNFPKQARQFVPPNFSSKESYVSELIIYESQQHQGETQYIPLYGFNSGDYFNE